MTDHSPSGMIRPDDTEQIKNLGKFLRQHADSIKTGSEATGSGTSRRVNFATPYEPGTIPIVVANPVVGNPMLYGLSVVSPDSTGFTINIGRSSGTTSFPFQYIAIGLAPETSS